MSITPTQVSAAAERWDLSLSTEALEQLAAYGALLLRWNERLSLTAIRNPEELIERHLMEGAFAAVHQPTFPDARAPVLDFGSGTGVPGIPLAICRADVRVTLAESQKKKAAFLQEVVRQLTLPATVHAGRAEALPLASFASVWMRAVDRGDVMLRVAAALVRPGGTLCVLGGAEAPALACWQWTSLPLPRSERRVLHIGTQ